MKTNQFTFTAGEVDPEAHGNIGLDSYRAGLAECTNFTLLAHGPAARRPGSYFEAIRKDSTAAGRLIPFVGTSGGSAGSATTYDNSVLIELGNLYARFLVNGDLVLDDVALTTATSITVATDTINGTIPAGWADGDIVRLSGTAQAGLTKFLDQYYELDNVVTGIGGSFTLRHMAVNLPVDLAGAPASPTLLQIGRVYQIVSPFAAADLANLRWTQAPDFVRFHHGLYATRELYRTGLKTWAFRSVSHVPTTTAPGAPTVTPTPGGPPSGSIPHRYVVTAIGADGVDESYASGSTAASNNITVAGNYNTISWSAVGGATRYNVYKLSAGVWAFLGSTTGTSIVDSGQLLDTAVTPRAALTALNNAAGNYPQAGCFFEGRSVFAGTVGEPDKVWASRSGTEANLTQSTPLRSDDAIVFRIRSQQRNTIQHLVPLNDILALTRGGFFRLFARGGEALAWDTVTTKPQGNAGANDVQPVVTDSSVLYVEAQASRTREVRYQPEGTGSYKSDDIMVLAGHLVRDASITRLAYTVSPETVLWAVRSDGVLLSMTHVPDSKIYAWAKHTTDGTVTDIAVLPEGGRDVLYMLVTRTTGGAGGKDISCIERLTPRVWSSPLTLSNAFFVDSGITYSGASTTTIDRLWHLEGREVQVLANGSVVLDLMVTDGSITLPAAATLAHVGLGYSSKLQTLPWFNSNTEAGGVGTVKTVSEVGVLVKDTSLCELGQTFDDMFTAADRDTDLTYDTPPPLFTGLIQIPVGLGWNDGGQVCVRQELPLPCTVLSVVPDTTLGG